MILSTRLRSLRTQRGLSQADLASFLHISRMTYTQYESGHREPGLQTLIDLADFYQISTDYLLGLSAFPRVPDLSGDELFLLSGLDSLSASRRAEVFHIIARAVGEELVEQNLNIRRTGSSDSAVSAPSFISVFDLPVKR